METAGTVRRVDNNVLIVNTERDDKIQIILCALQDIKINKVTTSLYIINFICIVFIKCWNE